MAQLEWTYIPNFGDKTAKTTVTTNEVSNTKVVEVVYGPDDQGKWVAIQTNGKYQLVSWKKPGAEDYEFGTEDAIKDLEESIQHKEALVAKAQGLKGTKDTNALKGEFDGIMNEWKTVHYYHTAKEDELFQAYQNARQDAYNEARSDVIANKEAIIAQAQAVAEGEDYANGKNKLDELMEAWKKSGFAGKDKDQELWQAFTTARNAFYAKRKTYFAAMSKENTKLKKAVIAKAEELTADVKNFKETNTAMQSLMDEWKKIGSAGKDADDKLWAEFNGIRQNFFDNRKQFLQEQSEKLSKALADKKALIEQAKAKVEAKDYSKAVADEMKELQEAWKKTGFAGKQNDALWNEFKGHLDTFWTEKKAEAETKRTKWLDNQKDAMGRKRKQIDQLWKEAKEFKDRAMTARSKEETSQLMEQYSDDLAKIKELESQIGDIERKTKDQ